ncbi:MAG TPA: hypothetical protein VK095_07575 [Beutenbergiaceae bacterium]|nr:hypothetical protein [Beutenbergiaceae bacterium]
MPAPPPSGGLDYTSPEAFAVAEQAYLDRGAEHNESGLFAWGESYYLHGLGLMYQAHADEHYLDRLEERVDFVLARTDAARGVSDYAGRSGPCWRASGNYTVGHGELKLTGGAPAIQIRWAGTTAIEAAARVIPAGEGTFDLELTHPSSSITLTGLSLDPGAERYVVRAVAGVFTSTARWTAIDHRRQHADGDELAQGAVGFEPQFYVYPVHTGMITLPMARYVRLVHSTAGLDHRRGTAERVLAAVRRSADHHWDDLDIDNDGVGDFRPPLGAPIPLDGGLPPLNLSHGLGATFAELYAITGEQRYRTQVEALLRGLRLSLTEQDGAYQWPYWPVHSEKARGFSAAENISTYTPSHSPSTQFEDISHAPITLEFVQSVHEAGIEDMSADRKRFAATFTDRVVRGEDDVWFRINGQTDALGAQAVQSARWLVLHDVEPAIRDHVLRVYQAQALQPSQGSHALGIAFLNRTA